MHTFDPLLPLRSTLDDDVGSGYRRVNTDPVGPGTKHLPEDGSWMWDGCVIEVANANKEEVVSPHFSIPVLFT